MSVISPKKALRKQQIIGTAAGLFMKKGFQATSMRLLAAGLGIEAPSLYNHIAGKQELLCQICFSVGEVFMANMDAVEKSDLKSLQKIEQLIRFHIGQMQTQYEAVYVSNRDWKHLQPPHLANFLQLRRHYEARFAAIIEAGILQKDISPIQPKVAVLTILSAIRAVEFWHKQPKALDAKTLENNIVQILVNGLRA